MVKIKVADLLIDIKCADDSCLNNCFKNYIVESHEIADMFMETAVSDIVLPPEGDIFHNSGDCFAAKIDDNNSCFWRIDEDKSVLFALYFSNDYSNVKIEIKKSINFRNTKADDFEYIFTGYMFSNRLTFLGGSVLHSSAISVNNNGIAFTAPSGTGKSTHTSLWVKKFGADVNVINDDKPAIRFWDGKPYIFGTPWCGKSYINSNLKSELKAVVCLERATENSICRMDAFNTVLFLTKQLPNPYYDFEIGKKSMAIINLLYSSVPIFKLRCNMNDDAVDTVYNAVFGGIDYENQ